MGRATRQFSYKDNQSLQTHNINVFDDEKLSMSMHAMSDFTNHPANGTVILDRFGFKVINQANDVICSNSKGEHDRLWFMPGSEQPHSMLAHGNLFIRHEPNAVFVSYMAGCFFNPCDSTFERAASKGWLGNLPRLTPSMIASNKPHSMETAYGHMSRLRQNLRSTSLTPYDIPFSPTTSSDIDTDNLHISETLGGPEEMVTKLIDLENLSLADRKALALYADATGQFPFDAIDGSKYVLVTVYKNYIHVEFMPSREAPSYVKAYRATVAFFREHGHAVSVARLDNETSNLLEKFFKEEAKLPFQFISAGTHRANKAERAIQSFKNHFIAGLASIDVKFPMEYWISLGLQAEITLNILRPYADDPSISAYEGIMGSKYDFLAHPLAPPGTRVVVYNPADKRKSWETHGLAGFYLGPALDHYREVRCYIPSTNGIRTSNQVDFFPAKVRMPGASTAEILLSAISKLQLSVEQHPALLDIQPALDDLKAATESFTKNVVPAGPRAPDGLTEEEVAQLTPPIDLHPVLPQRVEPIAEPQRVLQEAPAQRDVEDPQNDQNNHPLRTHTAVRPITSLYRPLTPKESSNSYNLTLKDRIGQHFRDGDNDEELVIDSVVMPKKTEGKGSKTPHFRMFLVGELQRPTALRDYQYTRCSEIIRSNYVNWIPRGQSAYALAIMATHPRDPARALNQTAAGKPLKFRTAMELDPALWKACDEEEWHRLLENTLRPVYHNQIPKSEKIAYYNKQVKEKLKVIDGKEFIEARVRGTLGGNVLDYKGPTSTNTADYTLVKILWSGVLHDIKHVDPNTFFCNLDMVDFYLGAPMEIISHMMIPLRDIPIAIVTAYDLTRWAINGKVYFKVLMSIYGHPAAGYLANRLLVKTILPDGYYEDPNIPCLFKHETRSTVATLVVDDFGVKASSVEDVLHLVESISKVWKVKI